jgi:hypothetical protein
LLRLYKPLNRFTSNKKIYRYNMTGLGLLQDCFRQFRLAGKNTGAFFVALKMVSNKMTGTVGWRGCFLVRAPRFKFQLERNIFNYDLWRALPRGKLGVDAVSIINIGYYKLLYLKTPKHIVCLEGERGLLLMCFKTYWYSIILFIKTGIKS